VAVSETVPDALRSLPVESSPIVTGDEEIFAAHVGGKLSVELKWPLDAGAHRITEDMKRAAAEAIFAIACEDLTPDRIVPSPLDPRVAPAVAEAVAAAAGA
jgi:malate dehydrogenase (oxaloacetate-decarboxylating)